MITCNRCAAENPEHARFCLACGKELAGAPAPREERRHVSIIFVDLVGFTERSEQLDPEDVRAILTPYHDCVRSEIESFGGIVEKFVGDAVMGVFGAPTAFGDDPERAMRAAFAVRDSVRDLNASDTALELQIRIAVNTGEAIVALEARPERGEAMVAGDVVNTTSRLQGAAPIDGILVGAGTYAATRHAIDYEPHGSVTVKGKSAPLEVWLAVAPSTAAGERAISEAPLVGRAGELNVLGGIWEQVTSEQRPHLVTIIGGAGVGKTRLGVEFGEKVESLGGRTVRGRSLPYRESSAYFALASQIKQLAGIYESDPIELALDKLRSTVTGLVGPEQASTVADHLAILLGLDPEGEVADRETLFFSVRVFIEAAARERPTMLVFEDLHWADGGLLDLVELLAGRLHDLPILLLALARPDLLDARSNWGGGLLAYTALPLAPLNATESAELAARLLPGLDEGERAERASALAATAEGNPLFIEELAAAMNETGSGGDASLPTTIRGIVAARLDGLPPAERALLLDAAVLGKVFWRGALERMSERTDHLSELLGALEARDLIRREAASIIEGDEQFTFKHVLIRDVAYELLPRAQSQQLHAEAARFFESATTETGEAVAALGRHWQAAGDNERAIEYFLKAAAEADRGWAKDRAVSLYRQALGLVGDDAERRKEIQRRLALTHTSIFHAVDARLLGRGTEGPPV
ncbi:MAG: adenylate/guanylate cyclase domain-containing protein [Actinomycetota bacterium]